MAHRIAEVPVRRVAGAQHAPASDRLAVEEPLEIRLRYEEGGGRVVRPVSVTMRTPGDDVALALGFLYAEGILGGYDDVDAVRHSGPGGGPAGTRNVVTVTLRPGAGADVARLERPFYTTSSCGVCGKTSLDALALAACPPLPPAAACLAPSVVHGLPEALAEAQAVFEQTGGLHAAA
ncbi:MAG: formate dehydrogenase accessory sulfurtransferase FdhD, partial [Rhodothermales bacterium]|nr:formate dehydrogenase accessory sulfurtransferase FdhD [Rhodothermales bacterium]